MVERVALVGTEEYLGASGDRRYSAVQGLARKDQIWIVGDTSIQSGSGRGPGRIPFLKRFGDMISFGRHRSGFGLFDLRGAERLHVDLEGFSNVAVNSSEFRADRDRARGKIFVAALRAASLLSVADCKRALQVLGLHEDEKGNYWIAGSLAAQILDSLAREISAMKEIARNA